MEVGDELYAPDDSHWKRGWVGPRTGMDVVARKKSNHCPYR